MKKFLYFYLVLFFLTACESTTRVPATEMSTGSIAAVNTNTELPLITTGGKETAVPQSTPDMQRTPTSTLSPNAWKTIPVFPTGVSQRMIDIYKRGLARGRNPSHFSKIGDCQNITPYFLAMFDNPSKFRLGDKYADLQDTIDHFSGSWSRVSMATHGGFNAATVLNQFWTLIPRPGECVKGESPSACEIRLNNPSFVIVSMEENFSDDIGKYDLYLRKLVDFILSQDVVPIIATRAESPASTHSINASVVQIANDYGIPLWNFGAAAASLPDNGLSKDGFHLTPGPVEGDFFFDDPTRMELGWVIRNLTALQSIDATYRAIIDHP